MTKESLSPNSNFFKRTREVSAVAAIALTAFGLTGCGSESAEASSVTCEIKDYTVGVDGNTLSEIAVHVLKDSGDTDITQNEIDTHVVNLQRLNGLNSTTVSEGTELRAMVCDNWTPIE